jgi:hypothetical protein
VFSTRAEMEEYLKKNPEKRLLSPSFLSPTPSPDKIELAGAKILGDQPSPVAEEKGGFTKRDYLLLSVAVTILGGRLSSSRYFYCSLS